MSLRTLVAWTLAIDLAASGLVRLRDPEPFAMIRPDPPTRARRVVGAVAVAELVIAAALVVRRTRAVSAFSAGALLVLLVPDNLRAAKQGGYPGLDGPAGSPVVSWARVVLGPLGALAAGWVARQ